MFVCDGAKEYDVLDWYKSRCLGHVLRRGHELRPKVGADDAAALGALQALVQEAIDLGERRDALTATGYTRRVQEIANRFDAWLAAPRRRPGAELERLLKHLGAHRGEWLVFLHEPGVPPTNNHAEQLLRPAVVSRKIGGCNKSDVGAATHSILSSILVTAKRLGHWFAELAVGWLRTGEAAALPSCGGQSPPSPSPTGRPSPRR